MNEQRVRKAREILDAASAYDSEDEHWRTIQSVIAALAPAEQDAPEEMRRDLLGQMMEQVVGHEDLRLRAKRPEVERERFESWLRSTCFREPPKHARDLAWSALRAASAEHDAPKNLSFYDAKNGDVLDENLAPIRGERPKKAEREQLLRELDESRALVAEANNSLYGSHGYFHSLDGGPFDKHHLARGIEKLKESNRALMAERREVEREREVCEWPEDDNGRTGCGGHYDITAPTQWMFCPFCGLPKDGA